MEIEGTNVIDAAPGLDGRDGHGRGRGRGRGGGRGRGRGRGANGRPIAPMDDSGDDNDDPTADADQEVEAFVTYAALDGESDADDDEERIAEIGVEVPVNPAPAPDVFRAIPVDVLGNPAYSMSYPFDAGVEQDTLQRYRDMSAFDIVLELAVPFFDVLRECSNNNPEVNISMKHLYLYHAFLTLRVLMHLDTTEMYYEPHATFQWEAWITELFTMFPLTVYYNIRRNLKGYLPTDDNPATKTKGWKVDRAVEAVRAAFSRVHRRPGEFLSFDEGMGQGSALRNPIYTSLGKAKPLEGFRFFLLVDYVTKVVLNFMLDTKVFGVDNWRSYWCSGRLCDKSSAA